MIKFQERKVDTNIWFTLSAEFIEFCLEATVRVEREGEITLDRPSETDLMPAHKKTTTTISDIPHVSLSLLVMSSLSMVFSLWKFDRDRRRSSSTTTTKRKCDKHNIPLFAVAAAVAVVTQVIKKETSLPSLVTRNGSCWLMWESRAIDCCCSDVQR